MNNLAQLLLLGAAFAAPTYAQCTGGPDALEDNDTCATAVAIPGNNATGLNVELSDLDFYAVTVAANEVVTVTITHTSSLGDIDGYIWDPTVACDSTIAGEGPGNGSLAQAFTVADIEVMSYLNTTGAPLNLVVEVSLWSGNTTSICNDYDIQIEFAQVPPITPACVETTYSSNNGGSPGGAVYFDVTAVAPTSIGQILTNFSAASGTIVGLEVYTTPGSYVGNEGNLAAWTLVAMDDANAIASGLNIPTTVNLAAPFMLPTGTTGIALVAIGSGHAYTNGTGANQTAVSGDGNLSLSLGSASNVPFALPTFMPRVWNGRLCPPGGSTGGPLGTPFCAALPNSTGQVGTCTAAGSMVASANDVTLTASNLPPSQFGIFVTSTTVIAGNPVGQGILCLTGQLGRYNQPGQILQANASGQFSLALDLTQTPLPAAFTSVMAGQTRSWQAWHRDFTSGGASTSNFTNGVTISFN